MVGLLCLALEKIVHLMFLVWIQGHYPHLTNSRLEDSLMAD